MSGKGGNNDRRLHRAESLSWFCATGNKTDETDFEYICQLANLVPSKIQEIAKAIRENGEELIEGFNFRTIRREGPPKRSSDRIRRPRNERPGH